MSEGKRQVETIVQRVIRTIKCKVEASVEFFSKVRLKLSVSLKLPKVYKIGQRRTVRNESDN